MFLGIGGFGYQSKIKYPPLLKAPNKKPDTVLEAKTYPSQAFYYRLTGDRNPLHINIKAAKEMKFKQPIIHGNCFMMQEWQLMGQLGGYSPNKFWTMTHHGLKHIGQDLPGLCILAKPSRSQSGSREKICTHSKPKQYKEKPKRSLAPSSYDQLPNYDIDSYSIN